MTPMNQPSTPPSSQFQRPAIEARATPTAGKGTESVKAKLAEIAAMRRLTHERVYAGADAASEAVRGLSSAVQSVGTTPAAGTRLGEIARRTAEQRAAATCQHGHPLGTDACPDCVELARQDTREI